MNLLQCDCDEASTLAQAVASLEMSPANGERPLLLTSESKTLTANQASENIKTAEVKLYQLDHARSNHQLY